MAGKSGVSRKARLTPPPLVGDGVIDRERNGMSRRGKKPYYGEGEDVNPYSKYRAKRTEIDGYKFASKMEGRRYLELKLMQQQGEISNLSLQPRFRLEINGVKICDYIADFRYTPTDTDQEVIEDVKGAITPVYRVKRNLMKAIHGIEILETTA